VSLACIIRPGRVCSPQAARIWLALPTTADLASRSDQCPSIRTSSGVSENVCFSVHAPTRGNRRNCAVFVSSSGQDPDRFMRQRDARVVITVTLTSLTASRYPTMWSAYDAHYGINADSQLGPTTCAIGHRGTCRTTNEPASDRFHCTSNPAPAGPFRRPSHPRGTASSVKDHQGLNSGPSSRLKKPRGHHHR
jgi:hypothetical protein